MKIAKKATMLSIASLLTASIACEVGTVQGATKSSSSHLPLYVIPVLDTNPVPGIKSSDQTTIGKYIKNKFNIVFKFIPYTGNYDDELNLMLTSGNYPQLLNLDTNALVTKYIQAGAALPLDNYIKNSKYLNKIEKQEIPYWTLPSPDGHVYKWEYDIFTSLSKNNINNVLDMMVRVDALKAQGYPHLDSTSSWVAFLKKAIKEFPTTNGKPTLGVVAPFAESWGLQGIVPILYENGNSHISIGNNSVVFNVKNNKYEDMLKDPDTKASIQFFNQLHQNGLLPDEVFTDTLTQVTNEVASGQALAFYYTGWLMPQVNKLLDAAGKKGYEYICLPIQTDTQAAQHQTRLYRVDNVRPFASEIITKNAQYPQRIFNLIDWMSSYQGQVLLNDGVEGINWQKDPKTGKMEMTPAEKKGLATDPNYSAKQGFGQFDFLGLRGGVTPPLETQSQSDALNETQTFVDTYKKEGWSNSQSWFRSHGKPVFSGLEDAVSLNPISTSGLLEQKLTDFRNQLETQLITAKNKQDFESVWNNGMKQYEAMHPETVVNAYNSQYQQDVKIISKNKQ